jgi:hypothetical protein
MNRVYILLFLLLPFASFAQFVTPQTEVEIPPRIFEYDAIKMLRINITQDVYQQKKAEDPGGMRHWTYILKKHLKEEKDFDAFWERLDRIDYEEEMIADEHMTFLQDTIFVRKYCDFVRIGKGDAFYDRIMVFMKDGEPVGLGKLSRHNNIGSFAPTEVFTDCFGQYNEMARMKAILD